MKYTLRTLFLFTTLFAVGLGLGLAIGNARGYAVGFQMGWERAPQIPANHDRLGPYLKARPKGQSVATNAPG